LIDVQQMVEKPAPDKAPSRMAVSGRYILSPSVFDRIRAGGRGAGGEIQLTDGIAGLIGQEKVWGYTYQGVRYDCGSKLGFLQATVELGMSHPQEGAAFAAYLKQLKV
jgi:UTP--glucose-1-phosphate uridylyltransferase